MSHYNPDGTTAPCCSERGCPDAALAHLRKYYETAAPPKPVEIVGKGLGLPDLRVKDCDIGAGFCKDPSCANCANCLCNTCPIWSVDELRAKLKLEPLATPTGEGPYRSSDLKEPSDGWDRAWKPKRRRLRWQPIAAIAWLLGIFAGLITLLAALAWQAFLVLLGAAGCMAAIISTIFLLNYLGELTPKDFYHEDP